MNAVRGFFSYACLLMLFSTVCWGQELKPEEMSQKVLPSVMTLRAEMKDGKVSVGTAFLVVKDGMAATAWHVVKDAKRVTAKFSNGEEYESSGVIDKDEKRNVALIKIKMFGRPLLQFDSTEPAAGSKAYAAIASQDTGFGISDATIDEIQTADGVKLYKFTSTTPLTNSGGPLLNAKGEVIGVMALQTRDDKAVSFAIPSAYVLGLDSSLATQPWDQTPSQEGPTAPASTIQPNDVIDKQLAEAMVTLYDFIAAYRYSDTMVAGTGFRSGVPQLFYKYQQQAESAMNKLALVRAGDEAREQFIQDTKLTFADCLKAWDYYKTAILIAQDATIWTAQPTDLWNKSHALIYSIPTERAVLRTEAQGLASTSPVFKEALPLEIQYALSVVERPSGFATGVISFARDPFLIIAVMPGSPAEKIGLYSGDKIISVGANVFQPSGSQEEFNLLIKDNLGKKLKVVIERSGKQDTFTLKIPKEIPKEYLITK